MSPERSPLLGAAEIRRLAEELDLRPTKALGQNFVHDANTVRRIVAVAEVGPDDQVLEVGPGLGSLTLALLQAAGGVTAVEIDARLAGRLPVTVAEHLPDRAAALTVITADALAVRAADLMPSGRAISTEPADISEPAGMAEPADLSDHPGMAESAALTEPACSAGQAAVVGPSALVANLPYNVAVPVLLHLLAELPSIRRVLVMVQAEVADRLAAPPGSRTYGAPSAKVAWYGTARRAGSVGRAVFWPVPGVDSALVAIDRHPGTPPGDRRAVFAVIDAAFAQRRKTLRSALSGWAGSAVEAERVLRAAGVDPGTRGEQLDIDAFARIAAARAGDGATVGAAR